jgi:hypothetical protein
MLLEGSCHCGAVRFRVRSAHPVPFNLCYCSICRKTQGGGGFAINLGGEFASLEIEGEEHVSVYHAKMRDGRGHEVGESPAGRHFCGLCGSALWLFDPRWPELIHPFASAIDSELPRPPERVHLMLGSKPSWVEPALGQDDRQFDEYPDESIAEWHERLGVVSTDE